MLLKSKNTFLLKYGTLTVHFNHDTKVFLKWKYFRTDFGTRMGALGKKKQERNLHDTH